MNKMVYMDNAATTSLHPRVLEAMMPYLKEKYANPSGNYDFARKVKNDIESARSAIAHSIGARPEEIYFTSGGTESNNTIIRGVAYNFRKIKNHIISTVIEHPSVLNTLADLEKELENEKRRRENSNNYRRPWKKAEKKNEESSTEEDNSIIPSNIKTEKMDIYTQEELEELDREEEENYDDDDDDIDYDEFDSYYDEK